MRIVRGEIIEPLYHPLFAMADVKIKIIVSLFGARSFSLQITRLETLGEKELPLVTRCVRDRADSAPRYLGDEDDT